jgi:hypothetical protein
MTIRSFILADLAADMRANISIAGELFAAPLFGTFQSEAVGGIAIASL